MTEPMSKVKLALFCGGPLDDRQQAIPAATLFRYIYHEGVSHMYRLTHRREDGIYIYGWVGLGHSRQRNVQ